MPGGTLGRLRKIGLPQLLRRASVLRGEQGRFTNACLYRCAAAGGLVTLAVLFGAVPNASAQDVTLEVWSHEADEPAKVAFRELAAKNFEKSHPGAKVKITWYEKNPLFARAQDRAACGQRVPTSSISSPTRPNTSPRATSFRSTTSVNWNNIEPWARKVWTHRRQDLRHSAGGLHRRALLQQGHAEAARRRAARECAIHAGAVPRPRQESARARA